MLAGGKTQRRIRPQRQRYEAAPNATFDLLHAQNIPHSPSYPAGFAEYISLKGLHVQPPKCDVCVICGVRPAVTVDHVPPKGFFKGVDNAQLRTVPACRECNNGASSDDEDVRFFISAQIGKQNPASKQLWESGAYKSILRKKTLREAFVANAREVYVAGTDGSHSTRIAFHVPFVTYERVLERTTRGLYFFHCGRVLPASVSMKATMLTCTPNTETEEIRMLNLENVGDDAFIYRYGILPDDQDSSLWIYEFHHAHWAMVTTGSASE